MPAPHHSSFYRLDAFPAAQPTESKHWWQRLKATDCSSCHVFHNRPGKRNRSRVSTQWLAEEQYRFDTVMHSQLSLASLRGRLIEYQLWLGYRRKCHLCRVAGNTVWSYMACEFPYRWGRLDCELLYLYTLLKLTHCGTATDWSGEWCVMCNSVLLQE